MTTYNSDNYMEQGGSAWRVGGTIEIASGGRMDINGSWYIGGTQVTATAAQLNAIDSVLTVANKTGAPLSKGILVYISGYDTTLGAPTVAPADADDATKKATLVLTEAIANDASGTAESEAVVSGLNTSTYSAVGSLVYESGTAGLPTGTAPTDANDDRRVVGVVKVKDATAGEIYFFPGRGGLEHAAVYLNNLTPGTITANGAAVVDTNKDVSGFRNLGATSFIKSIDAGITAHAGGGQASAYALIREFNEVSTVASDFDSVKLLTAAQGLVQIVKNSSANVLSVFPNTDDSINGLAVNLSIDIGPGAIMMFFAIDPSKWVTSESFYSSAPTTQKGGFLFKSADNAGNTIVTFTNASHAAATNVIVPDSLLSSSYVALSTSALTIAEMDLLDRSAQTETINSGAAVDAAKRITYIDNTASGAGAISLAVPDASMIGQVKVIEMAVDNGDVTMTLTNVQGGSAPTTCTWANVGDALVLVGGLAKWNVVSEGGVVLS